MASRAVADGADCISFGDTTGMATPGRVRELVGAFRSAHPDVALNLHFHNTRGTGLANVLTALELGVQDFDASVGGLGGCPYAPGATGNIATEELVHMVEDMGVSTGIDLAAMIDAAADAERIIGRQLPSQVLRPARGPEQSRHERRADADHDRLARTSSSHSPAGLPPVCAPSRPDRPDRPSRPDRPPGAAPGGDTVRSRA